MRVSGTTVLYVCAIALRAGAQEHKPDENANRSWAARYERAAAQFNSGHFAEALGAFEAALPLATTAEQRATTVADIGYSLCGIGRNVEAIAQFEQSLAIWRDIDPAGQHAIETTIGLANTQQAVDRHADAERTLRTAPAARPRDPASLAAVFCALGELTNRQVRWAEARDNFAAALKASSQRSENRVTALIGLADVDRYMRHWQEGIVRLNEALSLSRDLNDPMLEGRALLVLGNTYSDAGNEARAEPLLKRALSIFATSPAGGPQYVATLTSLGALHMQQRKNALAEDEFKRALSRDGGPADSRDWLTLQFLAAVLSKEQRFGEAGEVANRAYGIVLRAFGENSSQVASALGVTAYVEEQAGELTRAEHDYVEALRIMREHHILDTNTGLEFMTRYTIVLRKLHLGRKAKSVNAELKTFRSAARSAH